MKIFVASDIHGSAYFCQKMLDYFKREKADKLLLLGDILYHGPRNDLPKDYNPKAVIQMLNEYKDSIICVEGNCDSDVDRMVLQFPLIPVLSTILTENYYIVATHGHIYNPEQLPPMNPGDILLYGHTHIPDFVVKNGMLIANPGSVSIPKADSHNGYLLINNNDMIWKDFEGNIIDKKSIR